MKKKNYKKLLVTLIAMLTILIVSGCGFSVGNSTKSEGQRELFPDRYDENAKSYKGTNVGYKFSLDGYGELMVYVDTTEGHSFELNNTYGGFDILTKDGELALRVVSITPEYYGQMTAALDDLQTINNRSYFYDKNEQGVIHAFSYMADLGLDIGFGLETEDDSNLSLVAFRGEPLEGSSSNPEDYKGTIETIDEAVEDAIEEDVEDIASDEDSDTATETSITNSTLDPEVEKALASLPTDYPSVLWGTRYSASEDFPYFVISVTYYEYYGEPRLIVGLTNLYDKNIDFSGAVAALDADGNEIGDTFIYQPAIGTANTVIYEIPCNGEMPDGRLRWSDVEIGESTSYKYVAWAADYAVSGKPSDGYITVNYEFYSANDEDMTSSEVDFLVLDSSGFVIATGIDYMAEDIAAGSKYSGEVSVYADEENLKGTAAIATFSNPYVIAD